MQRLTLPSTTARGGWTFSPKAVREAIAFFKLEWAVEVKLSQGTRRRGAHRAKPVGRYGGGHFHSITVTTFSRPDDAGRTLWHELCHAAQAEFMGANFYGSAYALETRRHGRGYQAYRANKYEVEAREHESLNDTIPLSVAHGIRGSGMLPPKQHGTSPFGLIPVDIDDLLRDLRIAAPPAPAPTPRPATPGWTPRPFTAEDEKAATRRLQRAEVARRKNRTPETEAEVVAARNRRKEIRAALAGK